MSERDSKCASVPEEEWRPIPSMELYEVSTLGRIRSVDAVTYGAGGKKYTRKGRLLKTHPNTCGYQLAEMHFGDSRKTIALHRLVASTFLPPDASTRLEVNHIDGDKLNNCPQNLEWVTRSENMRHAYRLGLKRQTTHSRNAGEAHGNSKLIANQVRELRALHKAGISRCRLARAYGLSHNTVCGILTRKRWKHIA